MFKLIRIPRRTLLLYRELIHQRTYTNRNPLVRWIFWRRLAALLKFSRWVRRRRALDFGCGEGALLPTLCRLFQQVAAVDPDTAAAREVARHYRLENLSLVEARAPWLPFADGAFDFIVAADVLEHVPDLEPVAAELARVLAGDGLLAVSAPSENVFYELGRRLFGFTKPEDHYHEPESIERELGRHLPVFEKRYFPVDIAKGISAFLLLALGRGSKERQDGRGRLGG